MIQLRLRTEYSFGRTYAPITRIVQRLKETGCTAAGIVDSASTWGHVKWHKACNEAGIKPMLGVELIVSDEDDNQQSMWFLARNAAGLRQLYNLSTIAHRQLMPTKIGSMPRIFRDDVRGIDKANIITFAGSIIDADFLKEVDAVLDKNPGSNVLNAMKQRIAGKHSLRIVSTSDNFYSYPGDKYLLEIIADRSIKPSPQHILAKEELEALPGNVEVSGLVENYALNAAPMVRAEGSLEEICRIGIKERKLEKTWSDKYEQRLQHELALIREKDYESYFLIVSDMVRHAKKHMLVGPSRGSAAGSLVCYLTRITEIDPIPPGLFFERFIDVSRTDLPDIDLDFPDKKRQIVFDYMESKYGKGHVSHIGTITTFKPKSALIHTAKKLGIPQEATAAVKVAMIERSSADSRANQCLQDTLETTEPGKMLLRGYPQIKVAASLEGHASHTGVHAAGLLVCNEPIENFATIDANGIAQIEKGSAESIGLLKIDVLGLRTLSILEEANVDVDWYGLKFDDEKTFDIFNRGSLCGIFQFEGNAMRAVSSEIKFSALRDIDAVTALARPGPFSSGVTQEYLERRKGKRYESIHPLVESQMIETHGLPIYQEQTLGIVREIGKFDWKDTSSIRKAMSKRLGGEFFEKFWLRFKAGAEEQGISESDARRTWELINTMGAWQMNKAHTYSYAVISYWTAYLKAHYPLQFAAANLCNAKDEDSAVALLRELVKEGMSYVPFDPWESESNWSVQKGKLVGGFQNLHGIGKSKAEKLIQKRIDRKLTDNEAAELLQIKNPFADLSPFQNQYSNLYDSPETYGIIGGVTRIQDINGSQSGSIVFAGKLIHKNIRDANEEVNVKKRGGKKVTGPTTFIDLQIDDNTGTLKCRIDRYKFQRMGKEVAEKVPIDSALLLRAEFKKGIRFGFVTKWKRLDE